MRIKWKLSVPRSMPSLFRLVVLKLFKHVFEYLMMICPPPTPPRAILFSLSGWSAITFMRETKRSIPDHRSCPSENQNTGVILLQRWSSYVIWFVLHIWVEAWMAQAISYGGIDEGNSNTSCSVLIVGRNGRMRMVSLTNNFKFCRLNWK